MEHQEHYRWGTESILAQHEEALQEARRLFCEDQAATAATHHLTEEGRLRLRSRNALGKVETVRDEAGLSRTEDAVETVVQGRIKPPRMVGLIAVDLPYREHGVEGRQTIRLWYDSANPRKMQARDEGNDAETAAFATRGDQVVPLNERQAADIELRIRFAMGNEKAARAMNLNTQHLLIDRSEAEVDISSIYIAAAETAVRRPPLVHSQRIDLQKVAAAVPTFDHRFMYTEGPSPANTYEHEVAAWNASNRAIAVEQAVIEQVTGLPFAEEHRILVSGNRHEIAIESVPRRLAGNTVTIDEQRYTYHVLTNADGKMIIKLSTFGTATQHEQIHSISFGVPPTRGAYSGYELYTFTAGSGTQKDLVDHAVDMLEIDHQTWNQMWASRQATAEALVEEQPLQRHRRRRSAYDSQRSQDTRY